MIAYRATGNAPRATQADQPEVRWGAHARPCRRRDPLRRRSALARWLLFSLRNYL